MFVFFKQRIFAKIGLLFLFATAAIILSAYYFFDWSAAPTDNILDAHDAYYHYKLIDSWGSPPDTSFLSKELDNLHIDVAIYSADQDNFCENDTLLFWSSFDKDIYLCDYESFSDSDHFGNIHNINFPCYISFGDVFIDNELKQATFLEYKNYKYLLVVDYWFPNTGFNVVPLILLGILFMFFLYLLVTRTLLPISRIERRIAKLQDGDLDSLVKVSGEDELAVLSKNINLMVENMKTLLNQKERLLSDVSHELRSPLAKIRLALAMVPHHKKIDDVEKQIKTLDSLITNILLSDQMSTPYSNLDLVSVPTSKLIKDALDLTFVKDVEINLHSDYILNVDGVKVAVAIKNLLENAYKYGEKNNQISVECYKKNHFVFISVNDTGPGIPQKLAKKLTKAFVRNHKGSQPGFGLGLSICDKVLRAHGGVLLIEKNKKGGASCILKIPSENN